MGPGAIPGQAQIMNRLFALVGSAVVAGIVGWVPAATAQPATRPVSIGQGSRLASALSGSIEGMVLDERGTPLAGVMVSVLGSTSTFTVTDSRGAFAIHALPSGAYVVRAHLSGFAPSRRQPVEVWAATASHFTVTLQKTSPLAAAPAKAAPIPPQAPPKLLSAGLTPGVDLDPFLFDPLSMREEKPDGSEDRTEKAWRIRHLPRSVLKETTDRAATAPEKAKGSDTAPTPGTASAIARAISTPARFLSDLPLTGQVNVMTSGAFDGSSGFGPSDSVHGTANFAVAGPAGSLGDWSARVLTQSDLGSWFLAGAFHNRAPSVHLYSVGFSYSSQRVVSSTTIDRLGLERTDLAGRAAGSIYGTGRLVLSPRVLVNYGGRFSYYDYLGGAGLFSPNVAVTLVPLDKVRIRASASRRMLAPGAEEFLEPLTPGLWVPPERTFVGFSPMVSERTAQFELAVEHDLAPGLVVAVRSFRQNTANQQVAFFSVPVGQQRHYAIGNAGDVVAQGWSVGLSHHLMSRFRGSVAYEVTDAQWMPGPVPGQDLLLLGFTPRPRRERLHDVTTSVETDLPMTATHVYLAYRLNTAFASRQEDGLGSGLDSRFDLQVTQRLPFLDFTSARWQVLVAVKNMFRDSARDSSVYDELLVVKPPTRVLGGFVVKF
jgi:hypothetical protein